MLGQPPPESFCFDSSSFTALYGENIWVPSDSSRKHLCKAQVSSSGYEDLLTMQAVEP